MISLKISFFPSYSPVPHHRLVLLQPVRLPRDALPVPPGPVGRQAGRQDRARFRQGPPQGSQVLPGPGGHQGSKGGGGNGKVSEKLYGRQYS